ncbi:hypothetical protein GP5015_1405, partial [gamma proteobacterium HTCC5015]
PNGRYLYTYSDSESQIEALEIIQDTGQLTVPSSGNVTTDAAVDGLDSVTDWVFAGGGRYLFVGNSDPGNNGGAGLQVLRRGAGSETVDFPVALNSASGVATGTCLGAGLTATHEVYSVEFAAVEGGSYLVMSTVNAGAGELVVCSIDFEPGNGEDIELTHVDSYETTDLSNVEIDNPRDLKQVGTDIYYLNGGADSSFMHLSIDSGGALTYVSHIDNGPVVQNGLCEPQQITYSGRYPDTMWVTGAQEANCAGGETANAISLFKLGPVGTPQFQSLSLESSDADVRLDNISDLVVGLDIRSPLFVTSQGESAISYLRYNQDDEALENPAPLREGDLTESGTTIEGLQAASALALEPVYNAFMYTGGSNNVVGAFARISELDLVVRRSNFRIEPGRGIRFTASITNNGPADARDVELEVNYVGDMQLVQNPVVESDSQSIECEYGASSFTCDLSGMPVTDVRRITFTIEPSRIGAREVGLKVRSANRVAYDRLEATHLETIEVGSFKNGGSIAISPWALLLVLPWMARRLRRH